MPADQSIPDRSIATIRADLLDYLSNRIPDEAALHSDTDLLSEELLDSLLVMDLVAHIESAYGITLANGDIAPRHFRTIETLADLIADRRS